MFTLVVCLVVVALSGAAVLHIVLSDAPQRATLRPPPRREQGTEPQPPAGEDRDLGPDRARGAAVAPAAPPAARPPAPIAPPPTAPPPAPPAPPAPSVPPAPPARSVDAPLGWLAQGEIVEGSRARSATLLVVFLTSLGALLAVIVVVVVVLAAVALRGALG